VEIGTRAAAIGVVLLLSALSSTASAHWWSLILLTAVAVAGALPVRNPTLRRWRPVVEEALAAAVVVNSAPYDPALMPYLIVPPLSAGLVSGWRLAVTTSGTAAIVLVSQTVLGDSAFTAPYRVDAAQWVILALVVGLLGSWLRRLQLQQPTDIEVYAEAARLLTQLRDISRQLSGGLDAVSLAQADLESLKAACPYEHGNLFVRSPGGRLVLLATDQPNAPRWEPSLDDDSLWARAWEAAGPLQQRSGFDGTPDRVSLVVPLRLGGESIGLVGVERATAPFGPEELSSAAQIAADGAARIDAAQLFDEVRGLATAEERRRLAREIHDGVAQELASIGYAVDELTAEASNRADPDLVHDLRHLRREVSRVVSELRLSIFDLRTDVSPTHSLTAVLAEHARTVGAQAGLIVHLEIEETTARLRVEVETELLRIAQEAITNARKHAEARHLWVSCRIDPPGAWLRISDDGRGLQGSRRDSFGFDIMRERAARIGATLTVVDRGGGGTVVEVDLATLREGSQSR
jgi:signal transduction histidine kinase